MEQLALVIPGILFILACFILYLVIVFLMNVSDACRHIKSIYKDYYDMKYHIDELYKHMSEEKRKIIIKKT